MLVAAGCTPIPSQQAAPTPLRTGDALPALSLVTVQGRTADLAEARGGPLVLTFVRPYGDRRADAARELVARLAEARRMLRTDVAARAAFWLLLLDDPGGEPMVDWLPRGRDWRIGVAPEEDIRELAARLGVLLWDETEAVAGQTFVTTVVDAGGTIRGRLIGLHEWDARDLVGTIVTFDR